MPKVSFFALSVRNIRSSGKRTLGDISTFLQYGVDGRFLGFIHCWLRRVDLLLRVPVTFWIIRDAICRPDDFGVVFIFNLHVAGELATVILAPGCSFRRYVENHLHDHFHNPVDTDVRCQARDGLLGANSSLVQRHAKPVNVESAPGPGLGRLTLEICVLFVVLSCLSGVSVFSRRAVVPVLVLDTHPRDHHCAHCMPWGATALAARFL